MNIVLETMNDKQYRSFINYAMSTCTSFSIVLCKDEDNSANYILQDFYLLVSSFVISKKSIYRHPDTGTCFSDADLIQIKCCEDTHKILMKAAQIFDWNGSQFPEELCFYRDRNAWFTCVTHEKLLFLLNTNKQDIDFVKKLKIQYHL